MKWFLFLAAFATIVHGSSELLGEKTENLIKEGKLEDAKQLLKSGSKSIEPGIDFRLFQIGILENRLEPTKSIQEFLKNTQVVENIYKSLSPRLQKAFVEKLPAEFFSPMKESSCPYFEMNKRKQRAELLFLFLGKVSKEIRKKIIYELYVLLPEAVDEQKYSGEKSFAEIFSLLSAQELVKRMELLMTFGQNDQAHKVYTDALLKAETFSASDLCELRYADAKVLRKKRKYQSAQAEFVSIAESCPQIQLKARFMEIQLLSIKEDEESLPKFDSFVSEYPSHSFTDDVLYLKAQLLLSKNRKDEAIIVLDQLILGYPQGDMIEKALLLKAMTLAKAGENNKAMASFKHLEKISSKGSLDQAAAIYWQARLEVFPDIFSLKGQKKLSKPNKNKLLDLIGAQSPTVYSWLSLSLLTTLGEKPKPQKEKEALPPMGALVPELQLIKELIDHGFKEEALFLLDNITLDDSQVEKAASVARLYDAIGRADLAHQKLVRCNYVLAEKLSETLPIFNKISYPKPFFGEVEQAHAHVDIPKALIYGIMRQESGFLPQSCSWAGAKGLMQLIYPSAKEQSTWWGIKDLQEEDLYEPEINLVLASSLLKNYWQKFGNIVIALSAYNAGPSAAKRWLLKNNGAPMDFYIEEISFKETRTYVKTVLGATFAYGKSLPLPNLSF